MGGWDRERLRLTFDDVAELYERARQRYPRELFDDLDELAGLAEGAAVLEIGCGTGQATRELARRGARVVCVELGPRLAEIAREQLSGFRDVRVITSAFETWDPAGETFDLVFAATSWHWIDPDVRYERAARVLAPSGALAVVTTSHVGPEDADPFFAEIQTAYVAIGEPEARLPRPDEVSDLRREIEAGGRFANVDVRRYVVAETYTADEYVSLLGTYSGHLSMESDRREWLYGEIRRRIGARPGGRIRKHFLYVLHVARRAATES